MLCCVCDSEEVDGSGVSGRASSSVFGQRFSFCADWLAAGAIAFVDADEDECVAVVPKKNKGARTSDPIYC